MIRRIGNSLGATIPKSMLERYQLGEGDKAHLVETEQGILITPFDPEFSRALDVYRRGARTYRNAMRELSRK